MTKLYTVKELKELKVGDIVVTEFKNDETYSKDDTKVSLIDDNYIYFDDGYDFPINQDDDLFKLEVETEFAVQDSGDFTFKVFKK